MNTPSQSTLAPDSVAGPPPPVPAATVILVREKDQRLQVYLLQRSPNSGFMAGKYVFPGGMVDPDDTNVDGWWPHIDLDSNQLSRQLGKSLLAEEILPFCIAAIREMFEEAGVLLMVGGRRFAEMLEGLESLRIRGDLRRTWLRDCVVSHEQVLSVSALCPWSHWVTPERMSRRFDTRFFVAEMPEGQVCRPDDRETTRGVWMTPEQALLGNLEGKIPLSPPTLVTLHDLLGFSTINQLRKECSHRTWGTSIMPQLIPHPNSAMIVEPWDPQYGQDADHILFDGLSKYVLPMGEPFSRLWYHREIWRPISSSYSPDSALIKP